MEPCAWPVVAGPGSPTERLRRADEAVTFLRPGDQAVGTIGNCNRHPWLRTVTPVPLVDQIRHAREAAGDHTQTVLAEVLGLDAERPRQGLDHVVRRNRAVAVDKMVEIAGRQLRLLGKRAVRETCLPHQPLDGRAERVLAEASLPRHQPSFSRSAETSSPTLTALSSPFARSRTSTVPSSATFRPTVTRTGQPIRSASANFSPALASRSSSSTSSPAAARASAIDWPCSSSPGTTTTCTSYGATAAGHWMPLSSWCCSTIAAIVRAGP